jgi:hypothetical protein
MWHQQQHYILAWSLSLEEDGASDISAQRYDSIGAAHHSLASKQLSRSSSPVSSAISC